MHTLCCRVANINSLRYSYRSLYFERKNKNHTKTQFHHTPYSIFHTTIHWTERNIFLFRLYFNSSMYAPIEGIWRSYHFLASIESRLRLSFCIPLDSCYFFFCFANVRIYWKRKFFFAFFVQNKTKNVNLLWNDPNVEKFLAFYSLSHNSM